MKIFLEHYESYMYVKLSNSRPTIVPEDMFMKFYGNMADTVYYMYIKINVVCL